VRIASLIFGSFAALMVLAAPALAKNSHTQKLDEQPASNRARPTSRRPMDRGPHFHARNSAPAPSRSTSPPRERPTKTRTENVGRRQGVEIPRAWAIVALFAGVASPVSIRVDIRCVTSMWKPS
jgi:hypothetical protein